MSTQMLVFLHIALLQNLVFPPSAPIRINTISGKFYAGRCDYENGCLHKKQVW